MTRCITRVGTRHLIMQICGIYNLKSLKQNHRPNFYSAIWSLKVNYPLKNGSKLSKNFIKCAHRFTAHLPAQRYILFVTYCMLHTGQSLKGGVRFPDGRLAWILLVNSAAWGSKRRPSRKGTPLYSIDQNEVAFVPCEPKKYSNIQFYIQNKEVSSLNFQLDKLEFDTKDNERGDNAGETLPLMRIFMVFTFF